MKRTALLLLSFLQLASAAQLSIAVFPFKNQTDLPLYDWIGSAFPEAFFNKMGQKSGLQIWDPLYLFQVDSTGYELDSDSLITAHRNRWGWDVLIGGNYLVRDDSVFLSSRIIWATGKDEPLKMDTRISAGLKDFHVYIPDLVLKCASLLKINLSGEDSSRVLARNKITAPAFQTYLAGYGFEMRKNFDAAMSAFSRAVEIEPEFGSAWCRMASLSMRTADFINAREWYRRAVKFSPHDPFIIADAANSLVDSDLLPEASQFVAQHRKNLEKTAAGLKAIGNFYLSQGETQRAVASLTKAVASAPSDLSVEFSLGRAYLAAGEYTMAVEFFNRLIKVRPEYLHYYSSLGAAYRNSGRLMESSMVLESALSIDPENPTIMVDLAHTYFKLTWFDRAAQLLQKAREANPKLNDILVNLGVVYYHLGKKEEARKLFMEASSNSSLSQSALNNAGNVFYLEKNPQKAIAAYRRAYKNGTKNTSVIYNLAGAYLLKGNLKKAYEYFDELLSYAPGRIDILLKQAVIAEKIRKYENAEQCYTKVLDLSPYHEEALNGLVRILLAQNRYQDAARHMEAYLEHLPGNKEMTARLAGIYRKLGWYEVAVMKYQFLIRDFPDYPEGYLGTGMCMYDLIVNKGAQNYEDAIYALKIASQKNPENPEPDHIIGDIYMRYRGFKDLAVEHWEKALARTVDKKLRKTIEGKISSARK
ncbi:MAG TPA: DUF2989 domain-containing protein [Chitinispirillaceae bacterium]|nr:DUF2989 domain-containing protein [Chitinispirillaceae bacterium]